MKRRNIKTKNLMPEIHEVEWFLNSKSIRDNDKIVIRKNFKKLKYEDNI